jgi:hypothetical protein
MFFPVHAYPEYTFSEFLREKGMSHIMNLFYALALSALTLTSVSLTACNAPTNQTDGISSISGTVNTTTGSTSTGLLTTATPTPSTSGSPTPTPVAANAYPTCTSSNPSVTCIGLKVVSYESAAGVTDITETQAVNITNSMNTVWSQCNIAFQLEVYQSVNPTTLGLPYSPNWETQTDAVRTEFGDATRFLVVDVGPWSGATVAVTTMPGSDVYGSIIALSYADNYLTTAHEIAHYEGLYDEDDSNNLLSEVFSTTETQLTASQCATAVATNAQYWQKMLRKP